LLNNGLPIPGLPTTGTGPGTTSPSPSPSPSTSPSPSASPSPGTSPTPTSIPTGTLQEQIVALDSKLVADNAAAQAALAAGNYTAYGADETKVQADLAALEKLLAQQSPSPAP
jgi:hypothetical protein